MIYVFRGQDRAAISKEVTRVLGEDYEVFEGENLGVQELMNIFQGTSLLAAERKILIKDLTPAPRKSGEEEVAPRVDFYAEMAAYADTPHTVVIWESYATNKSSYKNFIKLPQVTERKFDTPPRADVKKVFDILDTAYRDGPRAVKLLREIQDDNDPYMFLGLMASQAIKKYSFRQGAREKRVLRELSRLDLQMKSTSVEPWTLISSFLLQVSSL